jgi:hypothetical protein
MTAGAVMKNMKGHVIDLHGMSGEVPLLVRIIGYRPSILIRVPVGYSCDHLYNSILRAIPSYSNPFVNYVIEEMDEYFGYRFGRRVRFLRISAANSYILKDIIKHSLDLFQEAWKKVDASPDGGVNINEGVEGLHSGWDRETHLLERDIYPVRFEKDLDARDIAYHFMVENDMPLCATHILRDGRCRLMTPGELGPPVTIVYK